MTSTNALWCSAYIGYVWREAGKCSPVRQESSWNERVLLLNRRKQDLVSVGDICFTYMETLSWLWCRVWNFPCLETPLLHTAFRGLGNEFLKILYLQTKWWLLTHPQETFKYVFFLLQHTRPNLVFLAPDLWAGKSKKERKRTKIMVYGLEQRK